MSSELFDYIEAIKPSLGDSKRAKIGLIIIHYITLARVSDGRVKLENVLTSSGGPFTHQVLRNMSLVRDLAFALKVDTSCIFDDNPVPEGLKRLCDQYYIDVDACMSRNKRLERAQGEMWDLVIFVRVALAVMAKMHEETLRCLDESYHGHRPTGYKPKSKWFGLGIDKSAPTVRARDLPRAKTPRSVREWVIATSTPISGPVPMARHTSYKSSGSTSSGSTGSKSGIHKRHPNHPCFTHRLARPSDFIHLPAPPSVPSQPAYFAQCAAMAAYYQAMQ